jgi:hypothetical protein
MICASAKLAQLKNVDLENPPKLANADYHSSRSAKLDVVWSWSAHLKLVKNASPSRKEASNIRDANAPFQQKIVSPFLQSLNCTTVNARPFREQFAEVAQAHLAWVVVKMHLEIALSNAEKQHLIAMILRIREEFAFPLQIAAARLSQAKDVLSQKILRAAMLPNSILATRNALLEPSATLSLVKTLD